MNGDASYVEIIHLSDLHYGKGHKFEAEKTPDNRPGPARGVPTLADSLIADLVDPSHGPARPMIAESASCSHDFEIPRMPKILCLTGDFTQVASQEEFLQAEKLIKQFAECRTLDLPENGVFLCPGNHDLKWDAEDDASRWNQYSMFLSRVTGKMHCAEDAEKFGGVQVCDEAKTVVVSLNTEMMVRASDGDQSRGDLHPRQLSWIRKQLDVLPDQVKTTYIKVAMLHHHPILLPSSAEAGRGYDAVTGANLLLPLLHEHKFHVVLHGHKHYPHTFREDVKNAFRQSQDHSLFVVAGGSCGSTELPSPAIATQCYNRIRIHWCAKAGTTRVQVVTRGLETLKPNREDLMPDQWHWKTLAVDDRYHVARRRPLIPSPAGLRYLPKVAKCSPANLARNAEYARVRGYFPIAEILPAMMPGQSAEVHLRIVQHGEKDNPINSGVKSVTWSGGYKWFPSVRIEHAEDCEFRTVFAYFGGALMQAELEFADGKTEIANVYVPMLGD